MKYFSLFSGVGGFELAMPKNYKCVGFSEYDKFASQVLKYNFSKVKNYGDITKIDWSKVPNFDLLTGGSPCQDLSIAGKRVGLEGKRSGLFYEYMRAVKEKKPKYFIWENVKGALSSNKGFDFASVLNEMAEAGYSLWWQVLNAKDFGIPQNRERIFVVGFRNRCPEEIFFEREVCQDFDKIQSAPSDEQPGLFSQTKKTKRNKSGTKNRRGGEGQSSGGLREITNGLSQGYRVYNPKGISVNLASQAGGLGAKTGLYRIPEATKKGYAIAKVGDSINLSVLGSKTRRGRIGHAIAQTLDTGMSQYTIQPQRQPLRFLQRNQKNIKGDYAFTIDASQTSGIKIGDRIRKLMPIECERIMSWPSNWTKYGIDEMGIKKEISDNQRYKMAGNGVVSEVVKYLIKYLIE